MKKNTVTLYQNLVSCLPSQHFKTDMLLTRCLLQKVARLLIVLRYKITFWYRTMFCDKLSEKDNFMCT